MESCPRLQSGSVAFKASVSGYATHTSALQRTSSSWESVCGWTIWPRTQRELAGPCEPVFRLVRRRRVRSACVCAPFVLCDPCAPCVLGAFCAHRSQIVESRSGMFRPVFRLVRPQRVWSTCVRGIACRPRRAGWSDHGECWARVYVALDSTMRQTRRRTKMLHCRDAC